MCWEISMTIIIVANYGLINSMNQSISKHIKIKWTGEKTKMKAYRNEKSTNNFILYDIWFLEKQIGDIDNMKLKFWYLYIRWLKRYALELSSAENLFLPWNKDSDFQRRSKFWWLFFLKNWHWFLVFSTFGPSQPYISIIAQQQSHQ